MLTPKPLPERVDALKLCNQGIAVTGDVPLARLLRLTPHMVSPSVGYAHAELQFGDEEHGRFSLTGVITAELPLECQRCLQTYYFPVKAECKLGVVSNDEQAKNLPRSLEPVMLDEEGLDLWSVIEEELLLNLPLAPTHPAGVCSIPAEYQRDTSLDEATTAKKGKNPFGVLSKLKPGGSE